jgi:hypothetical protein
LDCSLKTAAKAPSVPGAFGNGVLVLLVDVAVLVFETVVAAGSVGLLF